MTSLAQSSASTSVFYSVIRWFDSWAYSDETPADPFQVDWVRVIPFMLLHLGCLGVFWVGFSWTALAVAAAFYFVRMFGITGFYHRYFSHRTFKTSRAGQFLFALWGSAAIQKGPLWWAAHHRHHHRFSDKENDVHSPSQHGFIWSHVGWITSRANFPTRLEYVKDLASYPELRFLDRFDILVTAGVAALMFGLGSLLGHFAPSLGTNGLQILVWGFFVSTVFLFHGTCTINSLCHTFGRVRYETTDTSRNSFILSMITLGEGWHNNHHHFPAATRQGFFWWEVDITYYGLKALSWVGLIWDLRDVPEHVRSAKSL